MWGWSTWVVDVAVDDVAGVVALVDVAWSRRGR
jgi:hypothetical protein